MTNATAVSLAGVSKAEVLAALFNASSPAGMGFLQAANGPKVMDVEYAQRLIDEGNTATPDYGGINLPGRPRLYFDYLYGRPLKLDLTDDDAFYPKGFDRDNGGDGTAQAIIDRLRETHDVNPIESELSSEALLQKRRQDRPTEAAVGDLLEARRDGLLDDLLSVLLGGSSSAGLSKEDVCARLEQDGVFPHPVPKARMHLDWASDTALKYYDLGEVDLAIAAFKELVSRHEGTSWIATHPMTDMVLSSGRESRARMEYMMKGFAA